MRRLIANPQALAALRASLATAAIAWGLGQLQKMHEVAMAALSEVEADAAAAEARLARLLEAEEEHHETAAAAAAETVDADAGEGAPTRPLGLVVPEQRDKPDFALGA